MGEPLVDGSLKRRIEVAVAEVANGRDVGRGADDQHLGGGFGFGRGDVAEDDGGRALLEAFGFPFRRQEQQVGA